MAAPQGRDPFLKRLGKAFMAASDALSATPRPGGRRRTYAAGELGATTSDWRPRNAQADNDVKRNLRRHRARSRDLFKNEAYFKKYRKMALVNVIGPTGFTLKAQNRLSDGSPNVVVNKSIEAHWKRFLKTRVTLDGRHTYLQASKLALGAAASDGEVFIRKFRAWQGNPYGFGIQFYDADQLDERLSRPASRGQNEIRMGIEIDKWGAPVRYWFRQPNGIDAPADSGEPFAVPANEIRHLYDPERVNQTRGVPWGAAAIPKAGNLSAYIDAEIHKARMGASTIGTIEEDAGELSGMGDEEDEAELAGIEFVPGGIFQLPAGKRLNMQNPASPNQAFPDFVKQMARQHAVALNVWSNELASDAEGISYATGRLFKLAAEDDWAEIQQWWITEFERPMFEFWLENALLVPGLLNLGTFDFEALSDVEHQPRVWSWLDPLKEMQAEQIELGLKLKSPQRALAERNLDPETILDEIAEWQRMAKEKGVDLTPPPPGAPVDPNTDPPEDNTAGAQGAKSFLRSLGLRI